MSDSTDRVVVVGGGVIGAACAYYLRRTGRPVMLIDQGAFGRGCSHGNCGYVAPSHVLPLASPAGLRAALRALITPNSPLTIRWRLDPALYRWLWQFARRSNRADMLRSGRAIQPLLTSSRALYDELLQGTLTDVEWESLGLLYVFRTQRALDHYGQTDRLLRREFDLPATRFDAQALLELEPALKPGTAGAWHYACDSHLRPDKLMLAWRRALERDGVEIREHCALADLVVAGRSARSLLTSDGPLAAGQIVIATGAWTPRLRDMLGCPIAIQPGKGYSITMPRPAVCPRYPMILEERRVAITPLASMYRVGSTMEFAGFDASLPHARLRLLTEGAAEYLRAPLAEPVLETWFGWRPMTPDGLPFVGRVPAFDNVYLAAGHSMLGVSMSPATGRLVAELVSGETPHIDPLPYAVGRRL